MFQLLLGILGALSLAYMVYQIFFSESIQEKFEIKRNYQLKHDNVAKIARVKLVSDDRKDIEKFITENAQYLSNEMVEQLVNRIELIKNDQVISADTDLKRRIDALEPPLVVVEEGPVILKKAGRKK